MEKRYDLINFLITKLKYKTFLEIGFGIGESFRNIKIETKDTIEPFFNDDLITYKMTSDEFFSKNNKKYDIIFIDGSHEYIQVYNDILNSLNILNFNGCIVTHDTVPPSKDTITKNCCGDAWKAFAELRMTRPDLLMLSFEFLPYSGEIGCGIIFKGKQELLPFHDIRSYAGDCVAGADFFINNRNKIVNPVEINLLEKIIETL